MINIKDKIIISLKISFLLSIPLFITSMNSMLDNPTGQVVGIGTIIADFAIAFIIFSSLRDNEIAIASGIITLEEWKKAAWIACICVQGGFSILFLLADISKASHVGVLQYLFSYVAAMGLLPGIGAVPNIINFFLDDKKKRYAFEDKDTLIGNQSTKVEKKENLNSEPVINNNSVTEEKSVPVRKRRD